MNMEASSENCLNSTLNGDYDLLRIRICMKKLDEANRMPYRTA